MAKRAATKRDITTRLESLEEKNSTLTKQAPTLNSDSDKDTREHLAKRFLNYYFWLLIGIVGGVPIYNAVMTALTTNFTPISIKDAILTYSAVVGPTLGLVMAYYFENRKK